MFSQQFMHHLNTDFGCETELPAPRLRSPRILPIDRFEKGVVVAFEDGLTALYSAKTLYSILDIAEILSARATRSPAFCTLSTGSPLRLKSTVAFSPKKKVHRCTSRNTFAAFFGRMPLSLAASRSKLLRAECTGTCVKLWT